MSRLFVSNLSPRLACVRGLLTIEPLSAERAGALIYEHRRSYESLITYQDTCDVIAVLAGLQHFHRCRDPKMVDITLHHGDMHLIVSIKTSAHGKDRHSLGVFDFDFTLCKFSDK